MRLSLYEDLSLQITHPAKERLATPPSPTLFEQWCGFFCVPQEPDKWKCCETGPTVMYGFSSLSEKTRKSTPFTDVFIKAALYSQLFKDPEYNSGRGLNPRPPAQQTGALPNELTRRRLWWTWRLVKTFYYSFKIFPRFWLAKSTRMIHYNQLLITKFGRILSLTRKWRQKCSVPQCRLRHR